MKEKEREKERTLFSAMPFLIFQLVASALAQWVAKPLGG